MRRASFSLLLCFLACLTWAQTSNQGPYEQQLDADKLLKLRLHAGEYKVVPGKSDALVVVYRTKRAEDLKRVHIRFDARPAENLLVMEGPTNYSVRIEVPRQSDLYVRMTAGDLNIGRVEGNKDIELHAGDLNIDGFYPEDYGKVDLSVQIGDVTARPLNIYKGGFWRKQRVTGPGKYHLHAHVGVGDLTLHAPEVI